MMQVKDLTIPDSRPEKFEVILDQAFLTRQDLNTLERLQVQLNRFISMALHQGYEVTYPELPNYGRVEKIVFRKINQTTEQQ